MSGIDLDGGARGGRMNLLQFPFGSCHKSRPVSPWWGDTFAWQCYWVRCRGCHGASCASASLVRDIAICVTPAAQHAATGEIDRVTPEESLVRPDGEGCSRILRKLGEWRDGRSQGAA